MERPDEKPRSMPPDAEEVVVETRPVKTARVTVQTRTEERREWVEATLRREDVTVERIPIGRVVEEAPAVREEGDVLIVPVLEEQIVVEKRLLLKEELHIRKTVRLEDVREPVTLRSETATVTREELERES